MKIISSLAELEAKIAECNDVLTHESDDAMRRLFAEFRIDFSSELPLDPFSPAYRDVQMQLYRTLTGRAYALSNERTVYITAEHIRRPFPYSVQSSQTAGNHTTAIGFLLRMLDLPPGARILEFGPGWGNTTLALALVGYQVTAVDIEPNFCEIIRSRASKNDVEIEVVESDFFWAEGVGEPYDAVIFFECFHHCDDHMRLLAALRGAVKPGGKVFFGSEPINAGYPIPWGLRLDGESLWAMRNFGWLELGFDEGYFQAALARMGWSARKHSCLDLPSASVWEARRTWPDEQAGNTVRQSAPPARDLEPRTEDASGRTEREIMLENELDAIYRSTSWRLTAPVRALRRLLGQGRDEHDRRKTSDGSVT